MFLSLRMLKSFQSGRMQLSKKKPSFLGLANAVIKTFIALGRKLSDMTNVQLFQDISNTRNRESDVMGISVSDGGLSLQRPLSITDVNYTLGNTIPQKQVICIDFLEVTTKNHIIWLEPGAELPIEIKLPGVRLIAIDKKGKHAQIVSGTKHFQAKYMAFFDNEVEPFATVVTFPRKGGILPDYLSQIKIENRELYAKGWTIRFKQLLSALRVEINNISRLDIAIDSTCPDSSPFIGIYKGYKNNVIEPVGRKVFNTMYDHGNDTQGFDWGRKTSAKMLTGYIKSETIAKDGKQYIADYWKLNGIDGGRVERLELKLRTDCIKRTSNPDDGLAGVDIFSLERGGYMAGIMRAHIQKWFEFVPITSDSNKSRRERIQVIDWGNLGFEYLERIPTTKPKNETWAAKMAISKGLKDSGEDYVHKAASKAVAEALTDSGELCGEAAVKVVQEHLKQVFNYAIPVVCYDDLGRKLARAIAERASAATVASEQIKAFSLKYYAGMAKAHNLEDFFNKKARAYGV